MSFSRYTVTFKDSSNETSTAAVRGPTLNSGNIDATIALFEDWELAVKDVTLGGQVKSLTVADSIKKSATGAGERESKWLVSMVDDNGNSVTSELPTADPSLKIPGSDLMDISTGVGLALKNAIEAIHLSLHGENVTVESVRFVGRNL